MPIYGEVDSTISATMTDANDDPVEGADVTASLLRGATVVWTADGSTDAEGAFSVAVPDLPVILPGETPEGTEVILGEILVERVAMVSGSLTDTRETERRVRRRRG